MARLPSPQTLLFPTPSVEYPGQLRHIVPPVCLRRLIKLIMFYMYYVKIIYWRLWRVLFICFFAYRDCKWHNNINKMFYELKQWLILIFNLWVACHWKTFSMSLNAFGSLNIFVTWNINIMLLKYTVINHLLKQC